MLRRALSLSSDTKASRHQSQSFCWRTGSRISRGFSTWTTRSCLAMVGSTWWAQFFRFAPTPRDSTADRALLIKQQVISERVASRSLRWSPIFTCRNRHAPRQPVAVRLIRVVEPEVVVGSRKSVRELNRIPDLARWYRRVGRRRAIRRIVYQPIEAVLLFIDVGNFYHEVGTKAILQKK